MGAMIVLVMSFDPLMSICARASMSSNGDDGRRL